MISMLISNSKHMELAGMKQCAKELAARLTEENWEYVCISTKEELEQVLQEEPILDMACVDITVHYGMNAAKSIRKGNAHTFLILVADLSMNPMEYMKPDIMAGSLLLRPFTKKQLIQVFYGSFRESLKRFRGEDANNFFVLENKQGKQFVPYGKINYFEARQKKILMNTDTREFAFYDTMEHLEQELPRNFLRCHRSFIIAADKIKEVYLSKNRIVLIGDVEVPLSRSYKEAVKEYMGAGNII